MTEQLTISPSHLLTYFSVPHVSFVYHLSSRCYCPISTTRRTKMSLVFIDNNVKMNEVQCVDDVNRQNRRNSYNSSNYYALRRDDDDTTTTMTNASIPPISYTLRYVLMIFAGLGLFSRCDASSSNHKCRPILVFMAALFAFINLSLFVYTTNIFLIHRRRFGMLHATTVSAAITGLKPFIAFIIIITFFINFKSHRRLLRLLDDIDISFRSAFRSATPNVRLYSIVFIILTIVTFAIPLQLRIIEFWSMGER